MFIFLKTDYFFLIDITLQKLLRLSIAGKYLGIVRIKPRKTTISSKLLIR